MCIHIWGPIISYMYFPFPKQHLSTPTPKSIYLLNFPPSLLPLPPPPPSSLPLRLASELHHEGSQGQGELPPLSSLPEQGLPHRLPSLRELRLLRQAVGPLLRGACTHLRRPWGGGQEYCQLPPRDQCECGI